MEGLFEIDSSHLYRDRLQPELFSAAIRAAEPNMQPDSPHVSDEPEQVLPDLFGTDTELF